MDSTKIGPRLRLVGGAGAGGGDGAGEALVVAGAGGAVALVHASPTGALPAGWWARRAEDDVRRENAAAAGGTLAATDPRWVLALRVYESIEGGRAAVLRPQRRRNLVALATRLGLRPFDANLVIAIVQDSARSGERLAEGAAGRLAMVRAPGEAVRPGRTFGLRVLAGAMGAAAVLGYLLLDLLIGWVAR